MLGVFLLSLGLSGCIALPPEVERELTPPRAGDPDNFRQRTPASPVVEPARA
jgi:starvation-inducible outer membrane lipoprotein